MDKIEIKKFLDKLLDENECENSGPEKSYTRGFYRGFFQGMNTHLTDESIKEWNENERSNFEFLIKYLAQEDPGTIFNKIHREEEKEFKAFDPTQTY
jgi:hypothetical protein